jgi:protein involved in polysaccharide export with SLBB domain
MTEGVQLSGQEVIEHPGGTLDDMGRKRRRAMPADLRQHVRRLAGFHHRRDRREDVSEAEGCAALPRFLKLIWGERLKGVEAMRRGRFWFLFVLTSVALFAAQAGASPTYKLKSGDLLRLSVVGVPELGAEIAIDPEGLAHVPIVGYVHAAGRMVGEVETETRERLTSEVYKRYGPDGSPVYISIESNDVSVSILSYGPIYVSGDVRNPGVVVFRPGMTARMAIVAAGGSIPNGMQAEIASPKEIARLEGAAQAQLQRIAFLQADLWRLRAELAEDPDFPKPEEPHAPFARSAHLEAMSLNRRLLAIMLSARERERLYLGDLDEQHRLRAENLEQQAENQRAALRNDENEERRLASLFTPPMDELAALRRAQLDSSTRLLQTEDGLARVALERTRFVHELEEDKEQRQNDLLASIYEAGRRLQEAELELITISSQLGINGAKFVVPEAGNRSEPTVYVFRAQENETVEIDGNLDTVLLPGDVVETSLPINDNVLPR